MKKYSVIMTRDCTESVEIKVLASDPEEAIEKAYDESLDNTEWTPDDWAGKPYCGDPDGIMEIP